VRCTHSTERAEVGRKEEREDGVKRKSEKIGAKDKEEGEMGRNGREDRGQKKIKEGKTER